MLGRRGYTTVTGKGGERRMTRLGRWRWVMLGYALFVCALAVFLPMLVLTQAAFAKAWGRGFSLDNLTLQNFHYILFEQTQAQNAIINTFVYSGVTAFAAIGLSLAIAYVVTRKLVPWSNVLAFLCMAPFVIPGIVLAIGFYAAYAPPPLALYGTATILILAYTTRFLPIAYTSSAAGMRSINPEMEEAVRILGGSRLLAIRKVLAPLLEAQPRRRLDPGVHPGDARALLGDLPGRPEHAGDLRDAVRPVGGRQFRGALRARHDPAGRDPDHRGARLPRDRPRLHGALVMSKLALRGIEKRFGSRVAVSGLDLALQRGRVRLAARAVGLRQDHDLAHDRGLHRSDAPARSRWTASCCPRRPARCRRRSGRCR